MTIYKSSPAVRIVGAFGVALSLAAAVLILKGINELSLAYALRLTARWSFLLFWMAYTSGAMTALFGPAFTPLARRGREFGLAYAAAQSIHLGLVILFSITFRLPLTGRSLVFFSMGIFWTYLLAFFSFGKLGEFLGSKAWRTLRIAAMNYILFAFAFDFVPPLIRPAPTSMNVLYLIGYVPFAAMSVAAPLLVLAAAALRPMDIRYRHTEFQRSA
jgi:hypothetical protein